MNCSSNSENLRHVSLAHVEFTSIMVSSTSTGIWGGSVVAGVAATGTLSCSHTATACAEQRVLP
jgi:hypothetical protein